MNTTTTNDPWIVFNYEVSMFRDMYQLLQNRKQLEELSQPIRNAITESALLHSRQLVDILLSKGKEKDDIKLSSLLPGFQSSKLILLRQSYGKHKVKDTPCWQINKLMAHPTSNRTSDHDYTLALNTIIPFINDVLQDIEKYKSSQASTV